MPKRARPPSSPLSLPRCAKRSRPSTSPSPSHRAPQQAHLPLTYERLALHDSLAENQLISAPMPAAMPPPSLTTGAASSCSASPSKSSDKVRDNEDKLRYYSIHFCNRRVLTNMMRRGNPTSTRRSRIGPYS
ncbi:hypothetical protein AA0111_g11919 [Alternaria arborescens]|uniref:hypothetical protein n=1 Tax=Alternaria arborescens TaxID=156630 RepID=UPI001074B030|nr:hypothetical protein AA0111_g11919 [Alternaria arborescens]RYO14577.1 hypothetical protein AA0111_g11919 [Alternaria arborescens]